jgi:signal transduction histidine kinase
VAVESHLVALRSDGTGVFLELQAGTRTYMARLPGGTNHLPEIPLRSRVVVTGVYASEGNSGNGGNSFELLLNSPADVQVLERPSWWIPGHAVAVAAGLAAVLLLATGWIRVLRGQVERRTRQLRIEIDERKRMELEAEQMHKKLLETSRQAGMAEVATSVLHNVGNVLNSVNVSAALISDQLKQTKGGSVRRVAELLQEHESNLGPFLTSDPKGKQIPSYCAQLADHLATEQTSVLREFSFLQENIEHIKNIVAMQQNYARVAGVEELVKAADLVEDALRMHASAMERHQIQIRREYDPRLPEITLDKHKALQIVVNLLRNAKHACDESGRTDKLIAVGIVSVGGRIRITVADNGVGIPAENLQRIFNQGFTTRKNGHGFGLHGSILSARELGGTLAAHSAGVGQGAVFTLELPMAKAEPIVIV